MPVEFTIIDSFIVPPDSATNLRPGRWFILDGVHELSVAPRVGEAVIIKTPSGEELHARVTTAELHHRVIGLQLGNVDESLVIRLSTLSSLESGAPNRA